MSRIGNKAVDIPDKVKINIDNAGAVSVEGPKGKLNWILPRGISGKIDNNKVTLARTAETRSANGPGGSGRMITPVPKVQPLSKSFAVGPCVMLAPPSMNHCTGRAVGYW